MRIQTYQFWLKAGAQYRDEENNYPPLYAPWMIHVGLIALFTIIEHPSERLPAKARYVWVRVNKSSVSLYASDHRCASAKQQCA